MSLDQEIPSLKSPTTLYDLDGSDGPAHQPRSQAQYTEEVKAHLEAARAALRQLTVASVEALSSDPALDPVYVGCMRELSGLGCGHGGKEGVVVPKPIPSGVADTKQMALLAKDNASSTGYTFTAHFLPRETYTRCPRASRPSDLALTRNITEAMKKNPPTAHIKNPTTVFWTDNGDISIRVPPAAIGMEELVQQINILQIMKRISPPTCPVPQSIVFRKRGGPVSRFLRLHNFLDSWIPDGNWDPLSDLLHGIDSRSQRTSRKINPIYQIPESFAITGRKVVCSEGLCDVFIDLYGLEQPVMDTLRRACNSNIRMLVETEWDFFDFVTSFVEFED